MIQNLTALNDKPADYQIEGVEGTLATLWEWKEGKGKFPGSQAGAMRDAFGNEHRIEFVGREPMDINRWKGKRIRVSSKNGARGMSGVKLKVDEWKGKTIRKIWVTKTGILEELQNGQPARSADTAPSGGAPAPGRQGPPPEDHAGDNVELRIFRYFKILGKVYEGYEAMREKFSLPEVSEEEMHRIATHISMTFRGQYGSYAPPIFREAKPAQSTEPPAGSAPAGQDAPPEEKPKPKAPAGWREFIHPNKKMPLGKLHQEDPAYFTKLNFWALGYTGEQDDAKRLKANMFLAAQDLRLTNRKTVEWALNNELEEKGIGVSAGTLDAYAQSFAGVAWGSLTEDNFAELASKKEFNAMVKWISNNAGEPAGEDEIPE